MWRHLFPATRQVRRRGSTAARPVPRGWSDQRSRHGSPSHRSRGGNLCSHSPRPFFFLSAPHTTFSAWPAGVGDFSVWHAPGCSPPPCQSAAATWYSPAELTLWLEIRKRTPCPHAQCQVARLGSYGNLALKSRAQCRWTAPRGRIQPAQWKRTARNTADTEIGIPNDTRSPVKPACYAGKVARRRTKTGKWETTLGLVAGRAPHGHRKGARDSPISSLQCTSKSHQNHSKCNTW